MSKRIDELTKELEAARAKAAADVDEVKRDRDVAAAALMKANAEIRAAKEWRTVQAQNAALRRQIAALQQELARARA